MAAGLAAFGASWLVVAVLVRRAARWLLDHPNERSMHAVPTPRGGGLPVAVFAAIGLAVVAGPDRPLAAVVQAGLVLGVAAVGMIDDLRGLSWQVRMAVHLLAAAGALGLWGAPGELALLGADRAVPIGVGWVLATAWMVGLLNAYNFMDGIDGIAGTQAVVAAATWAAAARLAGGGAWVPAMALVGGASLGFLAWNWHPARIFMGDVASTALGYAFAVLPLVAASGGTLSPADAPWVGLGAVFPFVYDAASTFVRRALRGENVLAAHRTHTYQYLALRLGHPAVAVTWTLLAALSGAAAVAFAHGRVPEGVMWAAVGSVGLAIEAARWISAPSAMLPRRGGGSGTA